MPIESHEPEIKPTPRLQSMLQLRESWLGLLPGLRAELKEKVDPTQLLIERCLDLHRQFNQNCPEDQCFHNQWHIKAVSESLAVLVKAAVKFAQANRIDQLHPDSVSPPDLPEDLLKEDPLDIAVDWGKWNEQHPDAQIELAELPEIFSLAAAAHDIGNISQLVDQDHEGETGQQKLIFLDYYTAEDGEARSAQVAAWLIKRSSLTVDQKRRWTPLVEYLIMETVFMSKNLGLFGKVMRIADQIGGEIFIDENKRVPQILGLWQEFAKEDQSSQQNGNDAKKPSRKLNPLESLNFARYRLEQLVAQGIITEAQKLALKNLWRKAGKQLPEQVTQLNGKRIADRPQPVSELLAELGNKPAATAFASLN